MAKILVTGGAGFIGSHVAGELIKQRHDVLILDDLSGGFMDNVPPEAQFIKGSVTDQALIDRLFDANEIDFVFHLAAYAAEGLSHFIRRFNYTNNLMASINLINASIRHEIKCFVFTSSIAVYGENQLPMTEDMVPRPEDPYGIAKLAVENDLYAAQKMFGLPYIIFRPHNVYGENQNIGDRYRNVIGIFMNQLLRGDPMTIFGDGAQTRAFSYIGDVAPIIARSISDKKAYNQVFNVGADALVTVNDLALAVAQAMGVAPNTRRVETRNEVKHAYCEHAKIRKFLGYAARYDLESGINAMAAWVKKTGARQSREFRDIEIRKNLPVVWIQGGTQRSTFP